MKKLITYFAPVSIRTLKSKMKQVQNNIDMYTAIMKMPNTTKIKNNI